MNPTQNGVLQKDDNGYPVMGGTSSSDNSTVINASVDPITRRLLTDPGGGVSGILSINADTTAAQLLAVGTSGTDFAIANNGTGTHTFNLPTASAANRGALSSTDWSTFNSKQTAGNYITALTGDVTASGPGSVAATLATVNANVGSFTYASITVNGKGLITAASSGAAPTGTVTQVSVASANGFAGTVATATTTPAITLTTTINSPVLAGNGTAISAATTTGSTSTVVLQTSPTLITPVLGVATATSINKVAITAPATSATLTIADGKTATHNASTTFAGTDGKTLTVTNSIALAGTDSTVMTFPSTSATVARTDAAQTFTGAQTYTNAVIYTNNAIAASGNAATVPVTARLSTVTNNSAATLTITMTTTSAVDGQQTIVRILDATAAAQTITWVNTENSTISAPTTSNGSTTLPLTVGFMYNSGTSKWRCLASS